MKFGALLRTSAGEVLELQELFTAYKQLKKHLKVRSDAAASHHNRLMERLSGHLTRLRVPRSDRRTRSESSVIGTGHAARSASDAVLLASPH